MPNPFRILLALFGPDLSARVASRVLSEALPEIPENKIQYFADRLAYLELSAEDLVRKMRYPPAPVANYKGGRKDLNVIVQADAPPWSTCHSVGKYSLPGMLSAEEIAYYHYICSYYNGDGEVVELGPWLGLSTHHLVDALSANTAFSGKQLHVFDDFVWRSDWMDMYYNEPDRPKHHGDFLPVFMRLASDIEGKIQVHKGKIADYDGNELLPSVSWNGKPIEFLIADCGRTIQANQSWFDLFSPSFIPNKTLVIMQDWRLHRERPRKWYNQTKDFTDKNPSLELIHEIKDGGIATFLYRGN